MADTSITIIGNITKDPEVRFAQSGTALTSFSVAVNKSKKNKDTGEWENEPHFFDCVSIGDMAENIANSFGKGNRVIVHGELQQRHYQAQDGTEKTKVELFANEVGASVRWATLDIQRTERKGGGGSAPAPAPKKSDFDDRVYDDSPF